MNFLRPLKKFEIPDNIIHNIYSSFYARLVVLKEIGGVCLNGHWTRVKEVNNQYRTTLSYYTDPYDFENLRQNGNNEETICQMIQLKNL